MAPPSPKATAKGLGGKLGKKLGPLPVWAWLGLGAGLVLVLYLRARGDEVDEGYGPELVTGSSASPQDQAGAGAPAENAPPGNQLSPETFDSLFQSGLERFGVTAYQGELRGQIKSIEDALESQGWSFEDGNIVGPVGSGDVWPGGDFDGPAPENIVNSNGGVQKSPQTLAQIARSVGGVARSGNIYTTRRALAQSLGGARAYQRWAKNHPAAAQMLSGPAPRVKPKAKPKQPPRPKSPVRRAPTPKRSTPAARKPPPKPKPKPKPKSRQPAPRRGVTRRGI